MEMDLIFLGMRRRGVFKDVDVSCSFGRCEGGWVCMH